MDAVRNGRAVGVAALVIGLVTAVTPAWASTTPVGRSATMGLGALMAIYALWSLIARDPTKDHWALSVVGLILFMAPWVGMFAGDAAAWVSWVAGLLVMLLAAAAYVRDEATNVAETARATELAAYVARRDGARDASAAAGQTTPNAHTRMISAH
ncbi:MAG: SPW repeat protein [Aldersonia sp.]|nr:SPW repeat protein [Aldersonia sp.]